MKKSALSIIHEDDRIIVVDKPAGLLSVPDRYDRKIPNVFDLLTQMKGKVYGVHRLDRDTSGLLLFGKDLDTYSILSTLLEKHKIDKHYAALAMGQPHDDHGVIDLPIMKHERKHLMIISASGKSAETHYKIVERLGPFSLLDLRLVTGRTHQIRIHLSALGHPLLVDPLYGSKDSFFLSSVKKNYRGERDEERPILTRTPLHAHKLKFTLEGEAYDLESPLPKDMRATLSQLRKIYQ